VYPAHICGKEQKNMGRGTATNHMNLSPQLRLPPKLTQNSHYIATTQQKLIFTYRQDKTKYYDNSAVIAYI